MVKSPEKPKPAKRARGDAHRTTAAKKTATKKAPVAKLATAKTSAKKGAPKRAAARPVPRAETPHTPGRARVPRSTKRSAIPGAPESAAPTRERERPVAKAAVERVLPLPHSEPAPVEPSPGLRAELDAAGHVMELHWGDAAPSSRRAGGLVQRWVKRGDALLRHLAEHGAARHEYRADLKDGRFVWIDPEGRVSAEAQAQVLCSWSRSTSSLSMAWADTLVRAIGIPRLDGMEAELDDCDEEAAWRVAMTAADRVHAEYLYRVHTPHAWYFLALSNLTFHPVRESFTPSTPVGIVRRGLAETMRAVESRAEPSEVVRHRLTSLGEALLHEAEYAYRGTDWVARLERTGRRLVTLGEQLPRPSYGSVAAGRLAGEWLDRQATIDVSDMLALLEDEWALFT